jgi:hypothetical protein
MRYSLIQRSPTDVVCLSVIMKPRQCGGLAPLEAVVQGEKMYCNNPKWIYVTHSEILIVDFLMKIVYRLYSLARGSVFVVSVFVNS